MNTTPSSLVRAGCAVLPALLVGQLYAQSIDWFDAAIRVQDGPTAFDSVRGRVVMFTESYDESRTWEWNGVTWTRRDPAIQPTPRVGHALCYDARRRVVVLFGGQALGTPMADTWEYDGVEWIRRSPPNTPPWSDSLSMVYDDARGRCVLLVNSYTPSTWEYDGQDWREAMPATQPAPRTGAALTFDAARRRVVMFGGYGRSGGGQLDETWTWDGLDWSLLSPVHAPAARMNASMAFDPGRGVIVLFGGRELFPITRSYFDTWEWNGVDWRQVPTATRPEIGGYLRLVRDQSGVLGLPDPLSPQATWAFDGIDWQAAELPRSPSIRSHTAIAPGDARALLFGGLGRALLDDTWEWDGRWALRRPRARPSARFGHAIAFDSSRRRWVLFGGIASSPLGDTWEWDGSTWNTIGTPQAPSPRYEHALAYDSARRRVVLFGGETAQYTYSNETWEWDGARWFARTPPAAPTARIRHGMAYDPIRQRTVVFGGLTSSGTVGGDTWEWDGNTWSLQNPSSAPTPRSAHAMTFDSVRRRVMIFGGLSNSRMLSDTWEWDGSAWSFVATANRPRPRTGAVMAYLTARNRSVLFGSNERSSYTWELGSGAAARSTPFGAGCGSPRGTPRWTAFGAPRIGSGSFALDLDGAATNAAAFAMIGWRPASIPLGPCTLRVDSGASIAAALVTDSHGYAALPLPVPNDPSLAGLVLVTQVIVADPAGPFLSLAFSNGLSLQLGS